MIKRILYVTHYGSMPKDFFYSDHKTGQPQKIFGDGGSNIHIHLIQYFLSQGIKVNFSTYQNHYQYLAFFGKSAGVKFKSFWTPELMIGRYFFWLDNFYKLFFLPWKALREKINYDFVFSNTDFLPDVLYAFILKLRNKKVKWVAAYFLDAPKPWAKVNPYRTSWERYLKGILYWFEQRFSYWLIKFLADFVLLTSEPDAQKFITIKRKRSRIIVVQGGVDVFNSERYLKGKVVPLEKRKYDACFLGRFHYQKGVLELIDIWKRVCQKKSKARLAMIGNGPLEEEVRRKIKGYKLEKNVDLLGFMFGVKKEEIFKQSKIIIHPAIYDSGGMAAAEGMAWGLPAVGFDLESLRTYYPKGMIKVSLNNFDQFAQSILKILTDKNYYQKISDQAINLIRETWDWQVRADMIYRRLGMNKNE